MTPDAERVAGSTHAGMRDPLARVRESLQEELNVVLCSLLQLDRALSNRIIGCRTLPEALARLDTAVTIRARGVAGLAELTLLYRSSALAPSGPRPTRIPRGGFSDALMSELANQFLGAICQRLPEIRSGAAMTPPTRARLGENREDMLISHVSNAMSDSSALRLGWACSATSIDFMTLCLITIAMPGKTQDDLISALQTGASADQIEWLQ